MIRFRHAFLAIATVLFVHVIALGMGLYSSVEWFDVPMHFFGGYAVALLALAVWNWISDTVDIRSKTVSANPYARLVLEGIFVAGFVMIIGVAWEWYEFLFDQFATSLVRELGVAQPGLGDTMDDLFNDIVGGIAAWLFWRNKA